MARLCTAHKVDATNLLLAKLVSSNLPISAKQIVAQTSIFFAAYFLLCALLKGGVHVKFEDGK